MLWFNKKEDYFLFIEFSTCLMYESDHGEMVGTINSRQTILHCLRFIGERSHLSCSFPEDDCMDTGSWGIGS